MPEKQGEVSGSCLVQQVCPLCGEDVAQDPAHTVTLFGHAYAFCSQVCRDCFARTPEQFITQLAHEYDGRLGYSCPQEAA